MVGWCTEHLTDAEIMVREVKDLAGARAAGKQQPWVPDHTVAAGIQHSAWHRVHIWYVLGDWIQAVTANISPSIDCVPGYVD